MRAGRKGCPRPLSLGALNECMAVCRGHPRGRSHGHVTFRTSKASSTPPNQRLRPSVHGSPRQRHRRRPRPTNRLHLCAWNKHKRMTKCAWVSLSPISDEAASSERAGNLPGVPELVCGGAGAPCSAPGAPAGGGAGSGSQERGPRAPGGHLCGLGGHWVWAPRLKRRHRSDALRPMSCGQVRAPLVVKGCFFLRQLPQTWLSKMRTQSSNLMGN